MRSYGYDTVGKMIPAEAAELVRAADKVIEGESLRAIAADMNDRGVRTVTGAAWRSIVIKRALMNPKICGKRDVGGKLLAGDTDAIINVQTYRKIVKLLGDPKRQRFASTAGFVRLLTSVARCALCNHELTVKSTGAGAAEYQCKRDRGGCGKVSIRQEPFEREVAEQVIGKLGEFVIELGDYMQAALSASGIQRQIGLVEKRRGKAAGEYAEGRLSIEALRAVESSCDKRIEELRSVSDDGEAELPFIPDAFGITAWWASAPRVRQRDVIEAVVGRVLVHQTARRGLPGIDPERIEIEWIGGQEDTLPNEAVERVAAHLTRPVRVTVPA